MAEQTRIALGIYWDRHRPWRAQSLRWQLYSLAQAVALFLGLVWRVYDQQCPQRIGAAVAWAVAKGIWLT